MPNFAYCEKCPEKGKIDENVILELEDMIIIKESLF